MRNKAERWLAEQEIATLERMYELESPAAEREHTGEVSQVEARKVRLRRSASNASPSNGSSPG